MSFHHRARGLPEEHNTLVYKIHSGTKASGHISYSPLVSFRRYEKRKILRWPAYLSGMMTKITSGRRAYVWYSKYIQSHWRMFQDIRGRDVEVQCVEKKADEAEGLNARIFTYIRIVVYIRAILSRNIKRDCLADLCKYLWPANKRVLAEPKRETEG